MQRQTETVMAGERATLTQVTSRRWVTRVVGTIKPLHWVEEACLIGGRRYVRSGWCWEHAASVGTQRWRYDGVEFPEEVGFPESVCPCGVAAVIPLSMGSGDTLVQCAGCGARHEL